MYYFDPYWRIWVRRLLTLRGQSIRFLDISLTGDGAHEERIRLHSTVTEKLELESTFPASVLESMIEQLGQELAIRLLTFNYVGFYGLEAIVRSSKLTSGGVPASDVA
jgi:hypothetical protein